MSDRKTESRSVPDGQSREDLAEYWEAEDVTDHLDELDRVRVSVAPGLSEAITVRFESETIEELRARAREKGIGPSTFVRMLVLEGLKQDPM